MSSCVKNTYLINRPSFQCETHPSNERHYVNGCCKNSWCSGNLTLDTKKMFQKGKTSFRQVHKIRNNLKNIQQSSIKWPTKHKEATLGHVNWGVVDSWIFCHKFFFRLGINIMYPPIVHFQCPNLHFLGVQQFLRRKIQCGGGVRVQLA